MKDNWSRLLAAATVKKCVDSYRVDTDFTPYDNNKAMTNKACKDCMHTMMAADSFWKIV
jgi:hypothetical protein